MISYDELTAYHKPAAGGTICRQVATSGSALSRDEITISLELEKVREDVDHEN